MTGVLLAVIVYFGVFFPDYWFYTRHKTNYNYVSLRTAGLFILGIFTIALLNIGEFRLYFNDFLAEFSLVLALFAALLLLTRYFVVKGYQLYYQNRSLSYRLTAKYVAIKSLEITFQQITFLAITLIIVQKVGTSIFALMLIMQVILMMHSPLIMSINKNALYATTYGLAMLSSPLLFMFVSTSSFYPAIYIHAILYVLFWTIIGDLEEQTTNVDNSGDKWIKDNF